MEGVDRPGVSNSQVLISKQSKRGWCGPPIKTVVNRRAVALKTACWRTSALEGVEIQYRNALGAHPTFLATAKRSGQFR